MSVNKIPLSSTLSSEAEIFFARESSCLPTSMVIWKKRRSFAQPTSHSTDLSARNFICQTTRGDENPSKINQKLRQIHFIKFFLLQLKHTMDIFLNSWQIGRNFLVTSPWSWGQKLLDFGSLSRLIFGGKLFFNTNLSKSSQQRNTQQWIKPSWMVGSLFDDYVQHHHA